MQDQTGALFLPCLVWRGFSRCRGSDGQLERLWSWDIQKEGLGVGSVMSYVVDLTKSNRRSFQGVESSNFRLKSHFLGILFSWVSGRVSLSLANSVDFADSWHMQVEWPFLSFGIVLLTFLYMDTILWILFCFDIHIIVCLLKKGQYMHPKLRLYKSIDNNTLNCSATNSSSNLNKVNYWRNYRRQLKYISDQQVNNLHSRDPIISMINSSPNIFS